MKNLKRCDESVELFADDSIKYSDENGNLTMINTPGSKDISYAASCEMILLGTSVNLFGRYSARSLSFGNVVGLELKHSFGNVDVYGQGIGSLDKDNEDFSKYVGTFGFYTVHEYNEIKFGVNAEGQILYMKDIDDLRKRCAVDAGVSKRFSKCLPLGQRICMGRMKADGLLTMIFTRGIRAILTRRVYTLLTA